MNTIQLVFMTRKEICEGTSPNRATLSRYAPISVYPGQQQVDGKIFVGQYGSLLKTTRLSNRSTFHNRNSVARREKRGERVGEMTDQTCADACKLVD
jgi:hypothetical protein